MARIQHMRPLAFEPDREIFLKWGILSKIGKNHLKSHYCYLEKAVLELCRTVTIKLGYLGAPVFATWP